MPTKPINTATFATDAVFNSGPAFGFPTKIIPPSLLQGNIPGIGISAEAINYVHNIWGDWTSNWVFLGTNAADEDAHVVESNADGLISAALGSFGGANVGGLTPSLVVTSPATGDGECLDVQNTTSATAAVSITQNNGAAATPALTVSNATGSGDTAVFQDGAGNTGANVIRIDCDDARGLAINTANTAPAPLNLAGRNQPGSGILGDIYADDSTDQERLRTYHSGQFNSVWTTTHGFARGFDTDRTESSTAAGGFTVKASAVFVAADGLVSGETVHVRATCEIGSGLIGTAMSLRLRDTTAPADVIASEAQTALVVSAAATEKMVTLEADYTLPSSGARTITLEFSSNGVDTVYIRRASIEITGQY